MGCFHNSAAVETLTGREQTRARMSMNRARVTGHAGAGIGFAVSQEKGLQWGSSGAQLVPQAQWFGD